MKQKLIFLRFFYLFSNKMEFANDGNDYYYSTEKNVMEMKIESTSGNGIQHKKFENKIQTINIEKKSKIKWTFKTIVVCTRRFGHSSV